MDSSSVRLMRVLRSLAAAPEAPAKSLAGPAEDGSAASLAVADVESERLVREFDEAYTAFVAGFTDLPSESQMLSLQAVDRQLSLMVGAKDPTLWTTRARVDAPAWTTIRALAAKVIGEFGFRSSENEWSLR